LGWYPQFLGKPSILTLKKNTIRKGDGQAVAIPSGVIKRGNEWEIPKLNGCFHGKINDK